VLARYACTMRLCKQFVQVVFAIVSWPLLRAMASDRRARSANDGFIGFDDDDPGVDVDEPSVEALEHELKEIGW
jgi:hypothetical protein